MTTPDDLSEDDINVVVSYMEKLTAEEMISYLVQNEAVVEQVWLNHCSDMLEEQLSVLIAVAYASAKGTLSMQLSIPPVDWKNGK